MSDTKKTILAIDDDITSLNTLRTVLEGSYEVSLAKNTDIARTILNTARIDLILLDMNMPGVTGMDFLEFIRNDSSHYHIPVIIVSSQGTADVIVEIKKRGADDFAVKPVSPGILLEKIRSNLKTNNTKVNREFLEGKLKRLITACITGKSSQVEKIINGLEQVYCEQGIDTKIADICKYAREMEYNLVKSKAEMLLAGMLELQ